MRNFILASGSPRRIELLKKWGFEFKAEKADFAEKHFPSPLQTVQYNAFGKARTVARNHPDEIVIGADTIVLIDNKILGKPASEKELFEMLKLLSGKTHKVLTGLAAIFNEKFVTEVCETKVSFRKLSEEEIERYVKTGEGMDKAGGYAIQGLGASFANKIEGPLDNVIGLPINKVRKILKTIER